MEQNPDPPFAFTGETLFPPAPAEMQADGATPAAGTVSEAEPATEAIPEPYAPIPDDATAEQIAAHRQNYLDAVAACADMDGLDPIERFKRNELRLYLSAHFDPRELGAVDENVRAVLDAQLRRAAAGSLRTP